MYKIGLSDDNMLLVKAYQIKTLVVQDIVVGLENGLQYGNGLNGLYLDYYVMYLFNVYILFIYVISSADK